MAANPTKILLYDLETSIANLLNDLITFKSGYATLYERLTKLEVDLFHGDTKTVIQDLIDAYNNDFKGLTSERIRNLEESLENLQSDLLLASVIEASQYEEFVYDAGGNVTNHYVYTDPSKTKKIYEVSYTYDSPTSGVLQSSQKKVYEDDGVTVKQAVNKTYSYNASGDIVSITTTVV
jgi:hypothetical protein